MSRSIRVVSLVALCAVVASCASGGGRASVRPPELLTTTKPELAPSGITPNGARASLIAEIQVVVNTSGKADVSTLKISGPGAEANRNALTTWVQEARFKPGMQAGQPVSAVYRYSFSAMTRTVRTR